MKVYIDNSCDILYSSFYIYGLNSIYGKHNVKFRSSYFKDFKHQNHFFAFVVKDGIKLKKIIIDFTDSKAINETAMNWCDVYGKINFEPESSIKSDKLVVIGPSFGICIYSLIETLSLALFNLIKAYKRIPNKRKYLSDYKAQFNRPKYLDYRHKCSKSNYLFFMASLWKKESVTNWFRANFIRSAIANTHVHFEGGFAPRTKNDIDGFEELTTESRVSMSYYLEKIKDSALVFNTPAVKGCHGWKLAEYLCLGKAILSTPLSRELPETFQDGRDIVYSNGAIDDITEKVNAIITDPTLKQTLETHSKRYFKEYLAPQVVIKRLINK